MSETLVFTEAEARDIVWGGNDGYTVIVDEIIDVSRWSIVHKAVVLKVDEGNFYQTIRCS